MSGEAAYAFARFGGPGCSESMVFAPPPSGPQRGGSNKALQREDRGETYFFVRAAPLPFCLLPKTSLSFGLDLKRAEAVGKSCPGGRRPRPPPKKTKIPALKRDGPVSSPVSSQNPVGSLHAARAPSWISRDPVE